MFMRFDYDRLVESVEGLEKKDRTKEFLYRYEENFSREYGSFVLEDRVKKINCLHLLSSH